MWLLVIPESVVQEPLSYSRIITQPRKLPNTSEVRRIPTGMCEGFQKGGKGRGGS